MNSFELSQSEALSIYKESSSTGKKILEDKFGKDKFSSNIEDRIWSLQDACKENGTPIEDAIPYKTPKNDKQRCGNAFMAAIEIVQAFNEQRIPNWKDVNEKKLIAWWIMDGDSGFGLSVHGVGCGDSIANVASRLYLLNEKHVKLLADRFPHIYGALMSQKSN